MYKIIVSRCTFVIELLRNGWNDFKEFCVLLGNSESRTRSVLFFKWHKRLSGQLITVKFDGLPIQSWAQSIFYINKQTRTLIAYRSTVSHLPFLFLHSITNVTSDIGCTPVPIYNSPVPLSKSITLCLYIHRYIKAIGFVTFLFKYFPESIAIVSIIILLRLSIMRLSNGSHEYLK